MNKIGADLVKYGTFGISWVLVTTVYTYLGFAGGKWLDRKFNAAPFGLLAGMLLALVLSLRSLVREVNLLLSEVSANAAADRPQDPDSPPGEAAGKDDTNKHGKG